MSVQNNIKSYSIYLEYVELLEVLKESQAKDLFWKIARYMFYDEEPDKLTKEQQGIWNNLKRPLDKSKSKSKATSNRQSNQNQNNNQNETKQHTHQDVNVNVNVNNIYSYLENIFNRTLSSNEIEVINTWEDNELTRYAIKQADLSRAHSVKYIQAILNNYKAKGITTVQEAEKLDEEFQKRKTDRGKTSSEKMQSVIDEYLQEHQEVKDDRISDN